MKYYRAKQDIETMNADIIKGELLTPGEYKKATKQVTPAAFEPVTIKQTATHWFFGARWENDKCYKHYHPKAQGLKLYTEVN